MQPKSLNYYGANPIVFQKLDDNILFLKSARDTPEIVIDVNNNFLYIKGSCYLEKSPILFKYLEETLKDIGFEELSVKLDIVYINSSSTKQMIDLLEYLIRTVPNIKFSWRCEESDEDMEDLIIVTAENLKVDIKIIYYQFINDIKNL